MPRFARTGLAAMVLATLAAAAPAELARYSFDPTHSFVYFEVLHFDASTIRGRFGPLAGDVELDRAARRGRVQLSIDTTRLSTGLAVFDARLRESDMLAVEEHPRAFFVAERFEFDASGGVASVRGEFTLRGRSVPLTLTAQRFRCYMSPLFMREVCGGDFEATLSRGDFGISHSLPFVADAVRLRIAVEAIRQSAP